MNEELMDLIIKIKNCCNHEEEEIGRKLDLSPSEYRCMALIKKGIEYTHEELARKTGLSKSRGSRVFEKLVTGGWLIRRENSLDKRSCVYSVTPGGQELKAEINSLKLACTKKITANIDGNEERQMYTGLRLLARVMEEIDEQRKS